MTTELQVGDSVVVNPGTKDPDMGFDIGGWQGRVEEFYDDENTVMIRWDSITLKDMDYDLIVQCEIENLDWELMVLDLSEFHKSEHRDTEKDMHKTAKKLQRKLMKDPRLQ
jgi:hypothetical protein